MLRRPSSNPCHITLATWRGGLALWIGLVSTASNSGAAAVDYVKDIKPLLATACVQCHGADQTKGDLRLDTAAGALKGGASGPAVRPGDASGSLLVQLISGPHGDKPQMPYKRNGLSAEQIIQISDWVAAGAPAPEHEAPSVWTHWAFIKPVRPLVPREKEKAPRNPIDAFIDARLQSAAIAPSPAAPRATLIRRLYLDLIGLPPSVAEVDAFVTDSDPAAYSKLVDRLLDDPHYGERWGRWWLDQARYADSNGYSIDGPRSIWPYRDWVVNAINEDLPFDQFTVEQLAGDLLPHPSVPQLVATGFHRNTQINQEGGIDPEQFRNESIFDRVATTGAVWLGLTIGCCQCHDHKFDPISQREYYQFFAFFNSTDHDGHGGAKTSTVTLPSNAAAEGRIAAEKKELEVQVLKLLPSRLPAIATWEANLTTKDRKTLAADVRKALGIKPEKRSSIQQRLIYASQFGFNDPDFKGVNDRLTELEKEEANHITSLVMKELAQPRETHLFIKGDFTRPAEVVTPGVPAILPALTGGDSARRTRLDLARWIVSRDNPLTARVIVNRVWQQYFGKGLVETENDFGTQGQLPSHPELLDWLAVEFMERGWSLKTMQRWIVTSDAYRRSSHARADLALKDPGNRLLAHQNRLRLDSEVVRDICLSASGLLNPKIGGPPVFPPVPEGAMSVGQVKHPWPTSTGPDRYRRGLYTFFFRSSPNPELTVFDAPDSFTTCTRRLRSNTPLQALTLLNDAGFYEFAEGLAKIAQQEGAEAAFRRCMARRPSAEELAQLASLDPLTLSRVLLNLDETITRE